MKKLQILGALLLVAAPLGAAIDFGSESSTLAASGGIVALATASLTGGTLLDNGGSITTTGGATFTDVSYVVRDSTTTKSSTIDASSVILGTSMTLGDNQELNVTGGAVAETLSVGSLATAPAILSGYGSLGADITLGGATDSANYGMKVRWDSPLNYSINFSHTATTTKGNVTVTLEKDLEFMPGELIVAGGGAVTSTVDFNSGYTLSMGGVTVSAAQTWEDARLNMTGDVTVNGVTVTLAGASAHVNGNQNRIIFADGSSVIDNDGQAVTIVDTYLSGVTSASLTGSGTWIARNTIFDSGSDESLRFVNGSITSDTVDLFGGAATFNASTIDLLTDVSLGDTWTFGATSVIDGKGHMLDATGGALSVAAGATLELRNMTLKIDTATFVDGVAYTLKLSDVTVILAEDIDLSAYECTIDIDGPTTAVVGSYDWTIGNGTITNVTLLVDDLGLGGTVSGFSVSGNGRQAVMSVHSGDISVTSASSMSENIYLYAADTNKNGRTMTFGGGTAYTYSGYGRTIHCPIVDGNSSGTTVITVGTDSTVVTLEKAVVDGFIPEEHLSVTGTGTALYFGDDTTIRLGDDSVLATTLTFGSTATSVENMELDLCGHTLDMDSANAAIVLQGAAAKKLRIKNGTIANLSGTQISGAANSIIEFENVSISLEADTTFSTNASFDFYGHNVVTSPYGSNYKITVTNTLGVKADSSLTLKDDVTLEQDDSGAISLADASAVLELVGATLSQVSDAEPLSITSGTIIIDHKSTVTGGTNGITIDAVGDGAVNLVVRPGAKLTNTGGTLTLNVA